eukprot:m51a1_g1012 hypothetical protein (308) ;mRNA; f:604636-605793
MVTTPVRPLLLLLCLASLGLALDKVYVLYTRVKHTRIYLTSRCTTPETLCGVTAVESWRVLPSVDNQTQVLVGEGGRCLDTPRNPADSYWFSTECPRLRSSGTQQQFLPEGPLNVRVPGEFWAEIRTTKYPLFLQLGSWRKETEEFSVTLAPQPTTWSTGQSAIPLGQMVVIVTSAINLLHTNDKKELKHHHDAMPDERRARWVFEKAANGDYCIKNMGTGLYMMTPDRGVETWWDHCDTDRAAWIVEFTGVDDEHIPAGWTFKSRHNGRFLCAYQDDEDRVNVNRDVADTWEHFQIWYPSVPWTRR